MAMYQVKQSSTAYPLMFLMVDSTDHVTGKTGLSPTVTVSKSGASFGSPSGAVSEVANGWYKVAGNATDSGTLGPLALHATGTGADPVDYLYEVVAHDVQDSVRLGLSSLPNASANANGGLPILSSSGTTLGYTVSTLTTYTGNTVQTGDAYARIGSAGAGLTAVPASGDFTSTMKTSIGTAVAASAVASVTSAVTLDLAQTLSAARALDAIADTALTLNDVFHCAVASAAGKETVVATAYTVMTPFTGTVIRSFALTLSSPPTTVPTARA